ncbi:DUF6077 domain-containing protein [Nocardioides cheoyonin]|uniref:DUF6077 domain-containing protein n=1 Tax=Nocardioides cheoyonin TaxID=3156615 RepID=UPI0032B5F2F5
MTTWSDRVYDAGVVIFAGWTVAYHVCLVARLGVPWAWAIAAVCLVGWWLLHRRLYDTSESRGAEPAERAAPPPARPTTAAADDPPVPARTCRTPLRRQWTVLLTVAAAVLTAFAMAFSAPWWLVWPTWLLAAAAGAVTAWRWLRAAGRSPVPAYAETPAARWSPVVVLAWAVAMAAVSLWTLTPNPDDLFYINLSQWVASHGTFPIRDTVFSNLAYPIANWPPLASYDGLVGAVAGLLGVRAASVAYLLVPPVGSFLAVLALWRLLRAWRIRYPVTSLSVALVFMLVARDSWYGLPGDLFVTRMWQGKVLLLCLLVPWLLVHLARYADSPDRRRLVMLFTGGIAGVGLTTTAMFLVPVVAIAGAAPLARRSVRGAVLGCLACAAYPLGAIVTTKATGGYSADLFDTRRLYRFDAEWVGHLVFASGPIAFVAVASLLAGCLLVPRMSARLTTALLAGAFGIVLVPGVIRFAYDVTGLGPTLWRISWGCSIAALVGVVLVRLGSAVPGPRRVVLTGTIVVTTAALVASGRPITSSADWAAPFHWQRGRWDRQMADRVLAEVRPGGVVLAPRDLAITIAIATTSVKTVAPRDYYMDYLRDDPTFHFHQRMTLWRFASSAAGWPPYRDQEIRQALAKVPVTMACVLSYAPRRAQALLRLGMTPALQNDQYRCFWNHRPPGEAGSASAIGVTTLSADPSDREDGA